MKPRPKRARLLGQSLTCRPEQAEGKKLDARCDIFSFGSVLYEMVTGQQAFHGEYEDVHAGGHFEGGTQAIRTSSQEHSRRIWSRSIRRCLRKDRGASLSAYGRFESGVWRILRRNPTPVRWLEHPPWFGRHRGPGLGAACFSSCRSDGCRWPGSGLAAHVRRRRSPADSCSPHQLSRQRVLSLLLTGRQPGGVFLERGKAGQLRYLCQGHRH